MSLDAGKDRSVPDVSSSTFANLRRAKSLDRRVTESSMTVSTDSAGATTSALQYTYVKVKYKQNLKQNICNYSNIDRM